MSFEKKLKELENIVEQLGGGEPDLEESLKLFEKGVALCRECSKQLSQAEEKVQKLKGISPEGEVLTQDFEDDEERSH